MSLCCSYFLLLGQGSSHDFLFNQAAAYSYGVSRDFVPVSPQSGSLGTYGTTPVSPYTGTPNINIPLYLIENGDITIPISISYHPANVNPDNLPGLYGLGWTLQAGGTISRVINGDPDIGQRPKISGDVSLAADYRKHVYWADTVWIRSFMDSKEKFGFKYEIDPDEYHFNFNGYSGKFFASHDDTIKVQSKQGDFFSIIFHTEKLTGVLLNGYFQIIGFTIIDVKGVKYEFYEIEKTQTLLNYVSDFASTSIEECSSPTSWCLTKIISPQGAEVEFRYHTYGILVRNRFMDYSYDSNLQDNVPSSSMYIDNEKGYISYQAVPSAIISRNDSIVFNISSAEHQLLYIPYVSDAAFDPNFYYYSSPSHGSKTYIGDSLDTPMKIEGFVVYDREDQEITRTKFIYSYDDTKRLKLYGIDICRTSSYMHDYLQKEYRFSYDQQLLPPYLSGQTDHYGYYNGRGLFSSDIGIKRGQLIDSIRAISGLTHCHQLLDMVDYAKAPDSTYSQAELLKKITYPTKGYTTFEYEQHDYGKQQRIWPFEVINNSDGNQITGGVRIKSIRNYDSNDSLLSEKKYHYKTNYINGGTVSSGVLAYKPSYIDFFQNKYVIIGGKPITTKTRSFFSMVSNPVYPLANEGHIAYSEVTEEETGNGFTVYKYKNYDNGYHDHEPAAFVTNVISDNVAGTSGIHATWKNDSGISMSLERGQILSEEAFNSSKTSVRKVSYLYNDDADRFDKNVRFYRCLPNGFNNTGHKSYRITAGVHYTYFPFLKEKTIIMDGVEQKETYSYDENYNLMRSVSVIDSRNKNNSVTYRYPHDFSNAIHTSMKEKFMLSYVIEKQRSVDNNIVYTEYSDYNEGLKNGNNTAIMLNMVRSKHGNNTPQIEVIYSRYDKFGNVSEMELSDGMKISYIWSYQGQYPIAEIRNASYSDVLSQVQGGQTAIDNITSKLTMSDNDSTIVNSLRTKLPNAMITTYMYKPLVGMTSMTIPSGVTTYYEYDIFGRLTDTYIGEINSSGTVIRRKIQAYDYNYMGNW